MSGFERIVLKFGSIFRRISSYLGPGFADSRLGPAFRNALPVLDGGSDVLFDDDSNGKVVDKFLYTNSGILPVFFLGVLHLNSPSSQVRQQLI